MTTGSMGDTMRSWRIRQLFANKKSMTEQQLLEMFRDSTNPARQTLCRIGFHLRDSLKQQLHDEAEAASKTLGILVCKGASSRLNVPGAEWPH